MGHIPCWRCGSKNGLTRDGWCIMCCRTPNKELELEIERKKKKVKSYPHTYGNYCKGRESDMIYIFRRYLRQLMM